ncbi:hypothetical protein IB265_32720 [Ensifer sp. ENS10]|uniref:hypothetical protein n=1 Tax=Ensifer sp. ENS10 TaxID=2769286 RepID=UPI00177DEBFB|nr:hypothetical protein [Ensifer sp. ENS10]MBD9511521.1 hypothetical protein [Ensifer sp. ENS10]
MIEKFYHATKTRSVVGHTSKFANGDLIYIARKWHDEIFCCGRPSISQAIVDGVACWAIDHDHLLELRLRKVKWVSIVERHVGGDQYITTLDNYMNPACFQFLNFESEGGARQHYLSFKYFIIKPGFAKL